MAEQSHWNRPNSANSAQGTRHKAQGTKHGLVALVLVIAIGAGVWWWIAGRDNTPAPADSKASQAAPSKSIKQVAPSTSRKAPDTPPEAQDTKHKAQSTPSLPTYRDERGILRYEGGARAPDPTRKVNPPLNIHAHERKIFKHNAEEHIAIVLGMKVGEPVIGDFAYDERFVKSFKESLKEPIEILDTDSEQDREMKEAVIETKKELKARMDAGEDIAQIMNDTMDEFRRLGRYRHDLQTHLSEITRDTEKYSDQDVHDFTEAANKMLEREGIPPIKMPRLIMRGLRR